MTFATELHRRGEHAVHFSSDDHKLVASASDYLAAGLRRSESLLVVATAAHVAAFMGALAEAGFAPEPAQTRGRLTLLDAEEALDAFMVEGHPNARLFRSYVGEKVHRVAGRGAHVRIYGEMVAILWDAGALDAALELEQLWNELGADTDFSLLCGYRCSGSFDPARLVRVCAQHDAIVGDAPVADPGVPVQIATRTFDGTALDARFARRFTIDALIASGHGEMAEDAAIVVTELAANAIAHARSCFTVTLSSHEGRIRIAVRDDSPNSPGVQTGDDLESRGRGLRMVTSVADKWGTKSDRHGKVVWAELTS
jgi:anti-sigma regulatory factor (Ser/Thr protein kinase)